MDLPGFYFDAERNRYFPVSSRNTQRQRQIEAEQSVEIAKVQRGSSPNVETRMLQLIERREIGCNLKLETLSSPNVFQRHCMETLSLQPWIWSYFENGVEGADGAVEEIHAEIQTAEGLKGSDILISGRENALGMCEILHSKEVDEARFPPICPQRLFPPYSSKLEERSRSSKERPPHLSQCATFLHFQSKVTAIKRRTCNDVILTTLGSAREGGALHILKQNQDVADNWRHGQHLPFSIFRSAVTDSSVWTTVCCGHAKAALGTSRGAMLVDLESLSNKWLFRSKSDILSQECDPSGNILFCGFRNGCISIIDIRAKPQRMLMNPPRNFRRVKLQPETSFRKGGNSETWSHTFPINMDSAVCSMMLLHSDESYLLASAMNGDIQLWDRRLIGKGSVLKYEGNYNTHSMVQLWIDASDLLLASGGEDRAIRIWSLRSGKLLQTLSGLPSVMTRFSSPTDQGRSKLFRPSSLIHESIAQDHVWGTWMGSTAGVFYMHGAATNIP